MKMLAEVKAGTLAAGICHFLSNLVWPLFLLSQSYHDPESEEDSEAAQGSRVVPSTQETTTSETQPDPLDDRLEGEEREDLPDQPPPVIERPKESKSCPLMSVLMYVYMSPRQGIRDSVTGVLVSVKTRTTSLFGL